MPTSKKKYLFAGLGTMGYPMAGHLSQNNDIDVFVYNRSTKVTDKWLKEHKGYPFDLTNPHNVGLDGLILCLKDDAAITDVLVKKNLIACLKKNTFIIDHSTTSVNLVKFINNHQEIINKSIFFFDAPISGGETGAINGSLSVMFGGPMKKIQTIKKLMTSYSRSIVHIGPSGHGQLTKMVNQLCIAGLIQGLSEGIALGVSSNLNMNKVFDAISKGAAQSWQMDNRFKSMVNNKFDFGFAVDLMIKDLKISMQEARLLDLDLKITQSVLKNYLKLSEEGDGDLDTSSLIKLLNKKSPQKQAQ
ncbi:NAD(P)-dependent oxidoreductase [Gammaproteobacteria bacterium]|nr:NAD(P)-dependent oxidoreductase [Gammaproteobacteria bacterium]